ncbi:hypothetical protein [Devosia rhizoryzae]|uniref:Uncharacterized protein n=1 Tax=Devosia rhizoryzae TaxID=2774137 RepID=A0ABX7CBQ2_9HYPH|nr:hypothetical protein [Devosia rhizoryzae]QQR39371.1 hypothetical protein JI748_16895 [Devosia rhizoryzae]
MVPMMVVFERGDSGRSRRSEWQGRSGRRYELTHDNLENFAMRETDLYVIAKGGLPLWVGSTEELVADPMSRTRCRLALDCATEVLRMPAPHDRMAAIWDLENAYPVQAITAQAA